MQQTDSLKEELLETDETFRRLYETHQAHKQHLDEIRLKTLPSQEDEVEIKRIKVEKLRLKDQMALIIESHRQAAGAPA